MLNTRPWFNETPLQIHLSTYLFPPGGVEGPFRERRFPLLLAEALVGRLESGRLLTGGSLQETDCLLVEAAPLPVGEYLDALLKIVWSAVECERGHRETLFWQTGHVFVGGILLRRNSSWA